MGSWTRRICMFARSSEGDFARRANQLNFLSSPSRKNIPLNASGKSAALLRVSHGNEGRIMIVTNVRWDAVDAKRAQGEGA
jgi:hypothetical protein